MGSYNGFLEVSPSGEKKLTLTSKTGMFTTYTNVFGSSAWLGWTILLNASDKGVANGVPSLDNAAKIPAIQIGSLGTNISIKIGTISNGGVIPQTAGFSHYIYTVSPRIVVATAGGGYSASGCYSGYDIECFVSQTTRVVTVTATASSAGSGTPTSSATATYTEIAFN